MNEPERILAIFGILLTSAALVLSLATEIVTRHNLAEHHRLIAAGAPTGVSGQTSYIHHIGLEQQTLDSRWSFPDGHAALGTSFALFGFVLIAVPRATSKKRASIS